MTETLHRKRAGKPVLISTQAAAFIVKVAVPSSGFYLPCPFHVASFMYYCGDNMRFVTTHAFLLCGSQLQLPQGFLRPSQVLTMTRQKRQCRRFLDRSHGNVHCSLSITDIRSSIYFSCPGPLFCFFLWTWRCGTNGSHNKRAFSCSCCLLSFLSWPLPSDPRRCASLTFGLDASFYFCDTLKHSNLTIDDVLELILGFGCSVTSAGRPV